jgi:HAD superfamily, subfamily IIIB (Acid phosphatase)
MTHRRAIVLGAAVLLATGCATGPTPAPKSAPAPAANPQVDPIGACALGELHDFHGYAYPQIVAEVAELGRRLLEQELAAGGEGRPAMVLDIDETSLTNWGHLEHSLCAPVSDFDQYAARGESPALPAILELYRWARERDVTVFFVTGRREWLREATERNLQEQGYNERGGVFLRPTEETGSWHNYKAEARHRLAEQGYDILLNMGDQPADLEGGYARHALLLPNPFYVVTPRDFGQDEEDD